MAMKLSDDDGGGGGGDDGDATWTGPCTAVQPARRRRESIQQSTRKFGNRYLLYNGHMETVPSYVSDGDALGKEAGGCALA
jgi:hypothetical protein